MTHHSVRARRRYQHLSGRVVNQVPWSYFSRCLQVRCARDLRIRLTCCDSFSQFTSMFSPHLVAGCFCSAKHVFTLLVVVKFGALSPVPKHTGAYVWVFRRRIPGTDPCDLSGSNDLFSDSSRVRLRLCPMGSEQGPDWIGKTTARGLNP